MLPDRTLDRLEIEVPPRINTETLKRIATVLEEDNRPRKKRVRYKLHNGGELWVSEKWRKSSGGHWALEAYQIGSNPNQFSGWPAFARFLELLGVDPAKAIPISYHVNVDLIGVDHRLVKSEINVANFGRSFRFAASTNSTYGRVTQDNVTVYYGDFKRRCMTAYDYHAKHSTDDSDRTRSTIDTCRIEWRYERRSQVLFRNLTDLVEYLSTSAKPFGRVNFFRLADRPMGNIDDQERFDHFALRVERDGYKATCLWFSHRYGKNWRRRYKNVLDCYKEHDQFHLNERFRANAEQFFAAPIDRIDQEMLDRGRGALALRKKKAAIIPISSTPMLCTGSGGKRVRPLST